MKNGIEPHVSLIVMSNSISQMKREGRNRRGIPEKWGKKGKGYGILSRFYISRAARKFMTKA